jgi:hypothetical protein
MKVKLELLPMEFKALNKGLNPATPDPEVEVCAIIFVQSYRKRYTALRQLT